MGFFKEVNATSSKNSIILWYFMKIKIDDTFKAYGHLLKKNKLGKYVETRVYLSQSYFGFRNETKCNTKLFK